MSGEEIPSWTVRQLPAARHLGAAVFLGRRGGASSGEFASLNLSDAVGDSTSAVRRNWMKVKSAFSTVRHWVRMRQVHGTVVRVVDERSVDDITECDALVTAVPQAALCVLTADCVPVLIAASGGRPVAAVHAGWRGTAGRLVREVVQVLREQFEVPPHLLWAALGPSIGPCCYQVGGDVVTALRNAGLGRAIGTAADGTCRVDLRLANRLALTDAGLPDSQVLDVGKCTACNAKDFFSHRRQRGLAGRQLSFVVCAEDSLHLRAGGG